MQGIGHNWRTELIGSLSRRLLGRSKFEFAEAYCQATRRPFFQARARRSLKLNTRAVLGFVCMLSLLHSNGGVKTQEDTAV